MFKRLGKYDNYGRKDKRYVALTYENKDSDNDEGNDAIVNPGDDKRYEGMQKKRKKKIRQQFSN